MHEMSGHERWLPAERAFVIQLHVQADVVRGRMMGRAVHVVSGQATHFDSLEELLRFISRVLENLPIRPPAEAPDDP